MSDLRHQVILASAGTGKTYQLTNQILALLFRGVEPERILATTFTRKAASEILDRALERLVEGVGDVEKLKELNDALLLPRAITSGDCRGLLSRLVRSLDTFQVRTIDSFFAHLVRLFALDLELPPNWRISSQGEDETLRAEAMQDVLGAIPHEVAIELLRDLNSGRANRRVHHSLLDHVTRIREVYLECAEGAWERLDPGFKPSDTDLETALDCLSKAEVPLTAKGEPNKRWLTAVSTTVTDAESRDWEKVLFRGLGKVMLTPNREYYRKPIPDDLVEVLEPVVRRSCYELLARLRARNLATRILMERFEASYSERKRQTGMYRFDDLPVALSPRSASQLVIDARELDMWFRLDCRIDHVLLDEFQDTSPIQWRILRHIASEIAADGTGERTFFCVGDVKQSIYGFRQAEPRLLAELPRLLPGLVAKGMHESYRSSQVVLDTVNRAFFDLEGNPALKHDELGAYRQGAQHWQVGFHEQTAARELPGAAYVVEARRYDEGEREVDPLLERTVERAKRIAEEAPSATVGILMRERKYIAELIHRLRQQGIDTSGEGGSELTDSEAVLAFVSLLHLADHPGDTAAAFHVSTSRLAGQLGMEKDAGPEHHHEVARQIRARLAAEGLGALCADTGRRIAADSGWSSWDKARFEQLCELAFAFEAHAGLRTSSFVDHVRSQRVESPSGARVRVMTIHGSKGLEFDAVIVPELHKRFVLLGGRLLVDRPDPDGLIETVSVAPKKAQLVVAEGLQKLSDEATAKMFEDGLCTLYVAMTRAGRRLDLIVPWLDPERKAKVPSAAELVRGALLRNEPHEADALGVIWSHPRSVEGSGWAAGIEVNVDEGETLEPRGGSLELAPSSRARPIPRRSPSAEEGGRLVRAESLLRERRGLQSGTLVHRCLEGLEWIEDFELEVSRLGVSSEISRSLEVALQAEPIRAALSRDACEAPAGAELEVRNEHAFSLLLEAEDGEEQLWSGRIDRLVLGRLGDDVVFAEVLDYKTDILNPDRLAARVAFYRPQLEAYGRVVSAQTGLPIQAIRLRLLFLHLGRVIEI